MTNGTSRATITVSINDFNAFRQLKEIYPDVITMLKSGVFDFKRGRAIIHRDDEGKLRKVEIETTKWSE